MVERVSALSTMPKLEVDKLYHLSYYLAADLKQFQILSKIVNKISQYVCYKQVFYVKVALIVLPHPSYLNIILRDI